LEVAICDIQFVKFYIFETKKPYFMLLTDGQIVNKIYHIRGQKVMLDRDLAEMYGVETRRLNEQVKRNEKRFPIDFMFQLTELEFENLMSQFATSSWGGLRKMPFAFTEQGVAMLSSVLNSDRAIEVNIQIIRLFTKLRNAVLDNKEVLLKLEKIDKKIMNLGFDVKMHDDEIETIFKLIDELRVKKEEVLPERNPVGFKTKPKNI
jgi:hypothetical protein